MLDSKQIWTDYLTTGDTPIFIPQSLRCVSCRLHDKSLSTQRRRAEAQWLVSIIGNSEGSWQDSQLQHR